MVYDLNDSLHKEQFLTRAAHLAEKGGTVELTAKKTPSGRSNNYLHAIIGYFALHYGETAEYVKQRIFKEVVNESVFGVWRENEIRGRYWTWRSTSTLTQEELSLCIDRFRDYSAKQFGLYLPSPDDYEQMRRIEIEVARNKQYL